MLKKWTIKLSFAVMAFMCFAGVASANVAGKEVNVQLNGASLQFDVPPTMINNRVMVPMRVIFEALHATVKWDKDTQTITAVTETNDVVKLSIGNRSVWKNDKLVTIDSPPVLVDGRTLVPLRFVAESLGKSVNWEAASRTVSITPVPTAKDTYEKMIALKEQYPEGMTWTNDNFYAWQGGIYSGGYGCVGFAFILSDTAFGSLPARKHTDFDNIQVGDIIRVNNDTHSVVILSIDETKVTLAEGNYNSSIHWGRVLTLEQLKAAGDYIMTRYPN
jgi:hypothetical protein